MAQNDLFIDIGRNVLVAGRADPSIVALPPFVRCGFKNLRIWLLTPTTNFPNGQPPFNFVPVTGLTVQFYLGVFGADALLTQQTVWTASADVANPYFAASVSLNTDQIVAQLGDQAQLSCTLQVDMTDITGTSTVLLLSTTLKNAINVPGVVAAVPGRVPVYLDMLPGLTLGRTIVGHVIFVNDTDPTKRNDVYTDVDGTFKANPLT